MPAVIAHRGASHELPEHTLAAYAAALASGADGVECDVRLTADDHLVCLHDSRVDRTSNGHGALSRMERAAAERLDWGAWKGLPGQGLLTLDRLLDLVLTARHPQEILFEVKHPVRPAGRVERALADALIARGLTGAPREDRHTARVMSFSRVALERMRRHVPDLPLVLLVELDPPLRGAGGLPHGVTTLGMSVEMLRAAPDIVTQHHDRGHDVYVWTVDDRVDVDRCVEAGVDGIITDRPREVLSWLDTLR